jgi:hypothetical protein
MACRMVMALQYTGGSVGYRPQMKDELWSLLSVPIKLAKGVGPRPLLAVSRNAVQSAAADRGRITPLQSLNVSQRPRLLSGAVRRREAKVIRLDEAAIERALPLICVGLKKYCRLQAALATTDVSQDRSFQIRFNGFYRVRRNAAWQSAFYALLQQEKSRPQSFAGVLRALYNATGKVEASFASKLAASVDPGKPVIDAFVLKNLGLQLSRYGEVGARLARVAELHGRIGRVFANFLGTDTGRYMTTRFEECYPDRQLTPIKILDLVLWQTRQTAE